MKNLTEQTPTTSQSIPMTATTANTTGSISSGPSLQPSTSSSGQFPSSSSSSSGQQQHIPSPNSTSSPAVLVERVTYSYEPKNPLKPPVINDIDIHVTKSQTYALLGSSGCGKTTLLRLLVGRLSPQQGRVRVFGRTPNTPGCDVPGAGVGYMPQELALISQFTMSETFRYYGTLYQMTSAALDHRIPFLTELLDLRGLDNKFVDNMSGGQRRRVSLAIALIHNPPLLILDEPTVGVDPLLRETIWKYLIKLTHQGLTVIITTHYIEEARAADVVAFMRQGRLLAEDNPQKLMRQFKAPTLERVFLAVARRDSDRNQADEDDILVDKRLGILKYADSSMTDFKWPELIPLNSITEEEEERQQEPQIDFKPLTIVIPDSITDNQRPSDNYEAPRRPPAQPKNLKIRMKESAVRIYGLCNKNRVRLLRRPPELVINLLFPALQVALFCLCIGRDPVDIPVALCNQEQPDPALSQLFVDQIDRKVIILKHFDNPDAAVQSVYDGHAYASIFISSNFTTALMFLHQDAELTDEELAWARDSGTIKIRLDASNALYANSIRKQMFKAIESFGREAVKQSGTSEHEVARLSMPIKFEDPVYGTETSDMVEFMGPGMIVLLSFFGTTAVTSIAFLSERRDGSLERTLVAGASPAEFILAQVFVVLILLAVQIAVTFAMGFYVFEMPMHGNYFWAVALLFLQGVCGMCYGLMISSLCASEISAVLFGLGLMLPTTNITGMFWPVGTMPPLLRWVSHFLPHTFAMEAFRNIVIRGFGLRRFSVWIGFSVTAGWISIFLLVAIIVFKSNK